jgi:hypothetical protein
MSQRIDEIIQLLQDFALGEIDLPRERVAAALRLLDWAIDDATPSDGDEGPVLADEPTALVFRPKYLT